LTIEEITKHAIAKKIIKLSLTVVTSKAAAKSINTPNAFKTEFKIQTFLLSIAPLSCAKRFPFRAFLCQIARLTAGPYFKLIIGYYTS
jgi:hypothetical protein